MRQRFSRLAWALALPWAAPRAFAADPAPGPVPGFDLPGLLEALLSLAFVIALIVALAWLVGRVRGVARTSSDSMSVLAEIAVGPKERIVLVRIGDRQALLGVSAAGVTSLKLLEKNLELPPPPALPDFAQRLREAMKRTGWGR